MPPSHASSWYRVRGRERTKPRRIRTAAPPRSGLVGSAAPPVAWYQHEASAKGSGSRSLSQAAAVSLPRLPPPARYVLTRRLPGARSTVTRKVGPVAPAGSAARNGGPPRTSAAGRPSGRSRPDGGERGEPARPVRRDRGPPA